MSVTFKQLLNLVPAVTKVRLPVMLRGRHGVGKSGVVNQFAAAIGYKVVERRASQMTEGDLLGLPVIKGIDGKPADQTTWLPPDWLFEACHNPVVLFVDEIDRGTHEVRQGFFELTDSRKVAGWSLHPDTLIFSAINGGEHASQYQVGEMDPAELDRWVVFDVDPSVEDWLIWGKEKIHSIVWNFIQQNQVYLEHNQDYNPHQVYPTRRSWHRLSEVLKNTPEFVKMGESSSELVSLSCGFVGTECAVKLNDYIRSQQKVVMPADIFAGKLKLVESFELSHHTELVERFHLENIWTKKITKKQSDNYVKYFNMLPPELMIKAFKDICQHAGTAEGKANIAAVGSQIKMKLVEVLLVKQKEDEKEKEGK